MGRCQAPTRVRSGKANVPREETGDSTLGAAGVGVLARREGRQRQRWEGPLRSRGWQQPAKTFRIRAKPEIGGRVKAWRMSPYERGRKGNAFREGARRLPHQGNAEMGQRGSGHLAVTGSVNRETGMSHHKDQPAKQTNDGGVYVCQHLSLTMVGKACRAMPRSEPSRGNPAARDRREACGNVRMMGAGLRPSGKPLDSPPYPKMHARRTSIPTSG